MKSKNKRQTVNTFYFIFVLYGFSEVIIDPLIPIISEEMQVGFDKIGIALFIGSITTLISNFISGRLSDRLDIKKLVLFGLILISLGFALFGTYLNYIIFIMVNILVRVGFGTVDTTIHSFSTKLFKKDVSRIFLNLDIAWYTGAFLGPMIISSILFFDFLPRYLFFIIAFTYVVSIIIFYQIYPIKRIQKDKRSLEKDRDFSWRKGLSSLKDPAVIIGSLVLFFYMGSLMGLSSWMTTYFLSFGVRVAYSSAVLSMYWLFSIIGMLIVTKIILKIKEITILTIGCLLGTICLALFSFIPNVYVKLLVLVILAISFSVIFPLIYKNLLLGHRPITPYRSTYL